MVADLHKHPITDPLLPQEDESISLMNIPSFDSSLKILAIFFSMIVTVPIAATESLLLTKAVWESRLPPKPSYVVG